MANAEFWRELRDEFTELAQHEFIRCGHCGCSMVGEMKKKRYIYYHCTGYRGKSPERYIREELLTDRFADRLRELVITPEILAWLQEELVSRGLGEQAAREQAVRRLEADHDRLKKRLDILYDDRLDGRIDAGRYDEKARGIVEDQNRLRSKMDEYRTGLPPVEEAIDLMALTSKGADLFLMQSATEKRKLLRIVLGEAVWQGGELRMSFRTPFEEL